MPVRAFFSVIFALGTAEEEGSRTVPCTAEENCAASGSAVSNVSKGKADFMVVLASLL